jgi:O-antigen ligase
MLAAWLLAEGVVLLRSGQLHVGPTLRVVMGFWLPAYLALALGAWVAFDRGAQSGSSLHDLLAFALASLTACMISQRLRSAVEVRRMLASVLVASVVPVGFLFFLARTKLVVGPLQLYYGPRFRGWSLNPNQLALLFCVAPFSATFLARTASRRAEKVFYYVLLFIALCVGIATGSDALYAAWIVGAGLVGVLLVAHACKGLPPRQRVEVTALLVLSTGALLLAFGTPLREALVSLAVKTYEAGNQGETRLQLWIGAVRTIAQSPIVGLGPGAHAPRRGGYGTMESHSTYLDWGMSAGLVGVLSYVRLLISLGIASARNRVPTWLAAPVCMAVFSMFHYVLRHPTFWFYVVAISSLGYLRSPVKHSVRHDT